MQSFLCILTQRLAGLVGLSVQLRSHRILLLGYVRVRAVCGGNGLLQDGLVGVYFALQVLLHVLHAALVMHLSDD